MKPGWRPAALVAGLPVLLALCAFAVTGPPLPVIHDEFSYLLAGDTFAHGRLANPAHPLWRHFETFDVLSRPVFMSRKPPMQGLFLAAGTLLTGRPIAGVLLSIALACAATYWMLLAFVEPPWALAGGLLAGLHPVAFLWSASYMGGAAAWLGGALALGAWKRAWEGPERAHGLVFGLGLAVLANSRPFEGLVFALLLAGSLGWRLRRERKALLSFALGCGMVLGPAAAAMAYDNWRLTGSPLRSAYAQVQSDYAVMPVFLWQKPAAPRAYEAEELDEFWNKLEPAIMTDHDTPAKYAAFVRRKWARLSRAWLRPLPLLALFIAAAAGLAPWPLTAMLAAFIAGVTLPVNADPLEYYSAPAAGLFFALVTIALSRLWPWRRRGLPAGRAAVFVLFFWISVSALVTRVDYARAVDLSWSRDKDRLRRWLLSARPGRHLVLVRYAPGHTVHQEWVYNDADRDASPAIWARSLSKDEDAALMDYYKDRNAWVVTLGAAPERVELARPAP